MQIYQCPFYNIKEQLSNICQVFNASFSASEGENEGQVIAQFTEQMLTTTDEDQLYCFVAQQDQQLVGGVLFSELKFNDSIKAFILSPMAIHPDFQRQGIGQKLIAFALEQLKADGVELVITYGDPNYYTKVGFKPVTEAQIKAPLPLSFPHGWIAQSLIGNTLPSIKEKPVCVAALNQAQLW
ncbi:N-acetyltransferase [Catenovulum sp. SM1970]|uniref:GNAT family N-acetyltransferase n=1 Tax=Marinifaba aquimaris TaxID=2741323 RepID=UPI001571E9C0|nr:N-acetyltransferase [Marinifaba aquimaris]NTS78006.1 N-acetyltransferase [Marinifaba aquimaris]